MNRRNVPTWGRRISQERIQRNWRQQDLAEQLGTTRLTVHRWERGQQQPSTYYRLKLCTLFGKSAEELGLLSDQGSMQVVLSQHTQTATERTSPSQTLAANEERVQRPVPENPETPSPPPAWEQQPRPTLPFRRPNLRPLVGRESEQETIGHIMQAIEMLPLQTTERNQAGLAGHPSRQATCIVLLGEAGMGKTRLAEDLCFQAYRRNWLVAWTRAYVQEKTIPYRPWIDLLRNLLQDLTPEQIVQRIEGTTGAVPADGFGTTGFSASTAQAQLAWLSLLLPELAAQQASSPLQSHLQVPVLPGQEPLRLWEAIRSVFHAFSQSAPLLIVLDDLHWTDESSLDLFAYLTRHLSHERLLIIGSCRDTEVAHHAHLRTMLSDLQREQHLVVFPLQPLTSAQMGCLLAHLPLDLRSDIEHLAGGNPFFAEELARFGGPVPDGRTNTQKKNVDLFAERSDEQSTPRNGITRFSTLPETITAVLERRLHMLSAACLALISKAAVFGSVFELPVLLRMAGEAASSEDITLDLLEEALRTGLLTEEISGSRIVYHFRHPLIVNYLYERLSAARRTQLHRRVAHALIEMHAGHEMEGAAAIASHLEKDGQQKQELAYYAQLAGRKASTLSAYPEALHFYRLTLTTLQALPPVSESHEQLLLHIASLFECVGNCHMILGNWPEAREQYQQALELHSGLRVDASVFTRPEECSQWYLEEARIQSILWVEVGRTWLYTGDYQQAHECVRRGKEVLRAAGITDGTAWGCLQNLDGGTYWQEGNFSEAKRHAQESLRLHKEALRNVSTQTDEAGELDSPAPVSLSFLTPSQRALKGDPLELGKTHELQGIIAATMAQYSEALPDLLTALSIFETNDMVEPMTRICGNLGALHAMQGEYERAISYFKRSLDLSERTGDIPSRTFVTGNLGEVLARNGNLQEAEEWLRRSLGYAERTGNRDQISWCLSTLATIQLDRGDARGALESIRRSLAVAHRVKSAPRIGFALVTLAEWRATQAVLYHHLQAPDTGAQMSPANIRLLHSARAATERALMLEGIDGETHCIGQVIQAQISYLLGSLDKALQQSLTALATHFQSGIMQLVGRSQRLLGEIRAARGNGQEADASFAQALETFTRYGLRIDQARTLQCSGVSLLQRGHREQAQQEGAHRAMPTADSSFSRQGLRALSDACTLFEACGVRSEIPWVERLLSEARASETSQGCVG